MAGLRPRRAGNETTRLFLLLLIGALLAAFVISGLNLGIGYGLLVSLPSFLLMALFAPWIAPQDPLAQDLFLGRMPPVWVPGAEPGYWLGTDSLGRPLHKWTASGPRNQPKRPPRSKR